MRDEERESTHPSSRIPHPATLLVVRLSALGDVIHTIPAVMSLRSAFEIRWVVEAPYAEMVAIAAGVQPVPVRLKKWSLPAISHARR